MCNRLHEDSQPIPEEGTGWKVFTKTRNLSNPELGIWIENGLLTHDYDSDGWCRWDPERFFDSEDCGFCFMVDEESVDTFKYYAKPDDVRYFYEDVVKKIKYRKGLGHHVDHGFMDPPVDIALCREFKIIEE